MPEVLSKLLQKISELWRNLDKSQKNRIFITSGILIVAVTIGIILLTRTNYVPLLTIDSTKDLQAIQKVLDDQKINYKPGDNGQLLVDSNDKNKAEFALASSGTTSGNMTFEDAWSQLSISSTESDKKQLWNNFKKSSLIDKLKMFDNVKDADVDLALPETTQFFTDKTEKPTAFVRITPRGELSAEQVQGIVRVVSSSIINLKPSDVTVVDNNLNILSSSSGDEILEATNSQYKMKLKVKAELENSVKRLYAGRSDTFDYINVVANPILDFTKVRSTTNDIQNPTGMSEGAVISDQTASENLVNGSSGGSAGTSSNPSTQTTTYPISGSDNSTYNKKSETTNKEYKRVLTEQENQIGAMDLNNSSMSVALWYGQRVTSDTNLNQTFIDQLKSDVSAATGIPVAKISVNKYKLAAQDVEATSIMDTIKGIIDSYGFFIIMLVLVVGLIIAVVPRQKSFNPEMPNIINMGSRSSSRIGIERVQNGESRNVERSSSSRTHYMSGDEEEDLPDIELRERSETKKQIEKFVKQRPEAVAQLLRSWLAEDDE